MNLWMWIALIGAAWIVLSFPVAFLCAAVLAYRNRQRPSVSPQLTLIGGGRR
jgi:hypothetical protein